MKKVFLTIAIIGIIFGIFVGASYIQSHYSRQAVVIEINKNVVTFKDTTNNLWDWIIEENEVFYLDENVVLHMNNNLTDNIIIDDIIENVEKIVVS